MRKRTALKSRMGALVINPRKKATRKRNPRRSTKRRYGASRARRMTKRPRGMGALSVRRNPVRVRRNPLRVRRNPVKRHAAPKIMRAKRNPRHKSRAKRRNALRINPYMKKLEKIPFIGPFLAASVGMVAPAAVGAVSVEPQLLVNQGLARIYPNMPASIAHAVSGILLGAATVAFLPKTKLVKKDTAKMLGAAMAAGGGAVGYYIMKSQQDATVEDAMGALALRGVSFGNPISTVAQGLAGVGTLHGSTHSLPDYGSYGYGNAEAIYPANAAPQGIGRVISPSMTGNIG